MKKPLRLVYGIFNLAIQILFTRVSNLKGRNRFIFSIVTTVFSSDNYIKYVNLPLLLNIYIHKYCQAWYFGMSAKYSVIATLPQVSKAYISEYLFYNGTSVSYNFLYKFIDILLCTSNTYLQLI